MRTLLYINVFLTITELLWTIMGTIFTVHDFLSCQQNDQARPVIVAVLVVVCLSYVLIGVKVSSLKTVIRVYHRTLKVLVAVLSWRPSEDVAHTLNYRSLRCLMPCARQEGHVQVHVLIFGGWHNLSQ